MSFVVPLVDDKDTVLRLKGGDLGLPLLGVMFAEDAEYVFANQRFDCLCDAPKLTASTVNPLPLFWVN
jgi:hypothetical protein